jgi:nitroimidazol reductase NimA-like FMN-containing flavoprotein (pyridoxamine 5'-phosphate oxidase superfamily)
MLAEMQQLLKEQSMCVLATSAGDRPYCSLMAYAANADGTEVYMATHRSTRKFRNLTVNPAVSLMIDTRQEAPRPLVRALTVEGTCVPVTDDVRKNASGRTCWRPIPSSRISLPMRTARSCA